ncbi:DUF4270 family protein [Kaistella montana]|uniref:DUF4270 family protein n=1 Tax=Kaistella montana TaxID=1849733 RepID=A0ABW5K8B1_9FLAO|nr:DUF4270 family protein [Kaistella montana]MCQ4034297.1 DUF4270 domain-containing protein [Kaistella montana]
MIKNIKKTFNITASLVIGSLILWSCESDADQLGSQFFQNGAEGTETPYDVIAYNVFNGDSVRTDNSRLQTATLGAFNEPQFGLQKSAYVSQVRLPSYEPNFGTNAVLDSAVLVIKPTYPTDSVTTTTVEDYIYPDGNVAAKKVVTTYPITKYGKTKLNGGKTVFNIKVNEVTEFLGSNSDKIFSNKVVTTGALLGTKVFNGNISSIKVTKDSDNSELYLREANIRIPLDSAFFQNKIISKSSSPELADAASFIRYFKGLKISVDENDGYIFSFDPNTVEINLYYKNDGIKDADGIVTREEASYTLDLGSSNTHFNEVKFDRAGTASETALATIDQVNGDDKIFAQGIGGPGIGLRIPAATVAAIKELYKNEKIGIISAKIRLYTDKTNWDNNYTKPNYFVVRQRDLTPAAGEPEYLDDFLEDMSALAYNANYSLVKTYDLDKNPAYYDIGITQTFKNIIEKEADNHDLILNVGSYTTDTSGNLLGLTYPNLGAQNFNTRAYTPNRAVFVGSDPANDKRVKLLISYGKK